MNLTIPERPLKKDLKLNDQAGSIANEIDLDLLHIYAKYS